MYNNEDEKNLLIRNLSNRLQNGIIVNDTTYQLKTHLNDTNILKVVLNQRESVATTEPILNLWKWR